LRHLRLEKVHISYLSGTGPDGPIIPRRYTLTHSDLTGDLYLTIGRDYDLDQLSPWYTRLMRDEVLADWQSEHNEPVLAVHCHVSGGLVFGPARLRNAILRRELPFALKVLRFGDRRLFNANPALDTVPIMVYFHAKEATYNVREFWGTPAEYQ